MSERERLTGEDRGYCAHLHVRYCTEPCDGLNIRGEIIKGGATRGWWACPSCLTKFMPAPVHEGEITALRAEIHSAAQALQDEQSENDRLEAKLAAAKAEIERLKQEVEWAKDDLLRFDDACTYCLNPDVEDAWRHDHGDDGRFHWHHRLDPGDGLVSDCAHSEIYERVWDEATAAAESQRQALERKVERLREALDIYADMDNWLHGHDEAGRDDGDEWSYSRCGAEIAQAAINESASVYQNKEWIQRTHAIQCPCDDMDGKRCSYSNPAEANNYPCSCVCHRANESAPETKEKSH